MVTEYDIYKDKQVNLHFLLNNKNIYYSAYIISVDSKFITFKDKYGVIITLPLDSLRRIQANKK